MSISRLMTLKNVYGSISRTDLNEMGHFTVADLGFVERGFCSILAREIIEATPTLG